MFRLAPLFAALLLASLPALAQETPDTGGGRFVLEKAGDGFIRLDRETGAVSRCREKSGSWACESLADDRTDDRTDDRAALKAEIDRLTRQNEELRDRIAALEKRPKDSRDSNGLRLELPSQEDMDRFMALVESWMRRFAEFARSLGQDRRERQNI